MEKKTIITIAFSALLTGALSLSAFTFAWMSRTASVASKISLDAGKLDVKSFKVTTYKAFFPELSKRQSDGTYADDAYVYDLSKNPIIDYAEPTYPKVFAKVEGETITDAPTDYVMNLFDPSFLILNNYERVRPLSSTLVYRFDVVYRYNAPIKLNVRIDRTETTLTQDETTGQMSDGVSKYIRIVGVDPEAGAKAIASWRAPATLFEGDALTQTDASSPYFVYSPIRDYVLPRGGNAAGAAGEGYEAVASQSAYPTSYNGTFLSKVTKSIDGGTETDSTLADEIADGGDHQDADGHKIAYRHTYNSSLLAFGNSGYNVPFESYHEGVSSFDSNGSAQMSEAASNDVDSGEVNHSLTFYIVVDYDYELSHGFMNQVGIPYSLLEDYSMTVTLEERL